MFMNFRRKSEENNKEKHKINKLLSEHCSELKYATKS